MTDTYDEHRCPLCGRPNQCGMHAAGPCWCVTETVPAGLLARLPEAARGQACICRDCIRAWNAQHPETTARPSRTSA